MALYLLATPVSGNTISLTDYINEFNNIYNNSVALISPLTANVNAASKEITNFSLETLSATPSTQKAGRLAFLTVGKQLGLDDGAQIRFIPALTSITTGDQIIATSSNQYGKLAIGTTGQALVVSGGLPAWSSTLNGLTAIYVPTLMVTSAYATNIYAPTVQTTTLHATTVAATQVQTSGTLTVGGGTGISKILSATGSCVWPAHNADTTISTTITVTGATTTNAQDIVICTHSAVTTASVLMYGYVSAVNTVTVSLYNGTGAVYNPGSGTLRVTVLSHA